MLEPVKMLKGQLEMAKICNVQLSPVLLGNWFDCSSHHHWQLSI